MNLPLFQDIDTALLVDIATKAADAILEVYKTPFDVEQKADKSPLTEADKRSHEIICTSLLKAYPAIPVLSEESKEIPYKERKNWKRFWLIDPLDGTKEFVNHNGDFTVNIALIENGKPVLGVVFVPVSSVCFVGIKNIGAFKIASKKEKIKLLPLNTKAIEERSLIRVIASRSHLSVETVDYVNQLKETGKNVVFVSRGSSLKLCMIAEGEADIYPRFGPTMEWDTAAAQAVVEAVGGSVRHYQSGEALTYNKENLLNPWFVVQ